MELTVAVTLFTVVTSAVAITMTGGVRARRQSFESYRSITTLRDLLAEIQNTANLPQDLVKDEGIGAVYGKYHDSVRTITTVPQGSVTITCFPTESTVPAVLGGPQDLNFDGDAEDDHGNISNGTDLKVVPVRLTMTFGEGNMSQTITIHRLVTKTTD